MTNFKHRNGLRNASSAALAMALRAEITIGEAFYAYMTTGSAVAALFALAAPHLGGALGALLHGKS